MGIVTTFGTLEPGQVAANVGGALAPAYPKDLIANGDLSIAKTTGLQSALDSKADDADLAGYQPVDSDLTAIAALATTAFGRGLLTLANAAALIAAFSPIAQSDVTNLVTDLGNKQPLDSDLTAIAALTTTAYGRSLLEAANAAALRTLAGLVIGTDVQAFLVSATNIKTINGASILGAGDLTVTGSAAMPRGHIWGLTMSNAVDTANDITVAAGEARNEANTADMTLAAAITKRLDAGWAVGDAQGGLNTGAEANSTWYEVHLIKRSDTGVVDVMFTTTANRATLPANYDSQRRIGWIRNDGSGNILQFVQVDDHFTLVTPQNDVSATATASRTSRTLTAPPNTIARLRAACLGNTNVNAANAVVLSELVEADTVPATSNGFASIGAGDFAIMGSVHAELRVNASSEISDRAITATGSMAYDVSTFGWIDRRLRLSST